MRLHRVRALPGHALELRGAHAVVGEQAALVASHGEVVDEEGAGGGRVGGRGEGGPGLGEDACDVFVEGACFERDGADEFGGVGGQGGEVLRAFRGLHELEGVVAVHGGGVWVKGEV